MNTFEGATETLSNVLYYLDTETNVVADYETKGDEIVLFNCVTGETIDISIGKRFDVEKVMAA